MNWNTKLLSWLVSWSVLLLMSPPYVGCGNPVASGLTDWILKMSPKQYKDMNEMIYSVVDGARAITRNFNGHALELKLQPHYPDTMPFPCDVSHGRSRVRPISVHALRPGDIDVIGAMGDSITAGYGAIGFDMSHIYIGNRGYSFTGGGVETWRTALTLPNILKAYNPRLVGFSTGTGLSWSRQAQFNTGEGFALSDDMPHQATLLMKRMKSDPRVNFEENWKIVSIFIGNNDICSFMCFQDGNTFVKNHLKHMLQTLDFMRDNIPRLLVNIIPVDDLVRTMREMSPVGDACHAVNALECTCLVATRYRNKKAQYEAFVKQWQQIDFTLGDNPRYHDKPDFAVVVQPFTRGLVFPTTTSPSGQQVSDFTYLAPDCFHFSQKGHAIAANALWNNMLEPIGNKSTTWSPALLDRFLCPTTKHPYIYTHANS